MRSWKISYQNVALPDFQHFETEATNSEQAIEAFITHVQEHQITLRLSKLGEEGGQPSLGLLVSVLVDDIWINPEELDL